MTQTGASETLPARPGQSRIVGDRAVLARLAVLACLVLMLTISVASLTVGAAGLPLGETARALLAGISGHRADLDLQLATIVLDIRLPRVLLGLLVGASLALSGAMMQGLFRNPLADPGLVGVSSGAALAAVIAIVLGGQIAPFLPAAVGRYLLPLAAFVGGLGTTALLYRLATVDGRTSIAAMLLVGIALAAIGGALTGILVFISNDQQLRELTFWTMGGLGGATWPKILAAAPLMLPAFAAAPFLARGLNAMTLGEAEAFHLGVDVQTVTRISVFVIAAAVGAAVAVSGIIGFIGLVAPHLLRITIGPDHRTLLPASALFGATLLVAADVGARTLVAPAELPIGILTALIGAPFFLWLLLRRRSSLVV
ncbi:FecCD family ABC transporter permease [Consotaella aegiceratis]|uniref:FecCD family ABC transporter permease n=1 Tax=Consotaella aegiceratis TaxID=3097961 RepID=UPI002F3F5090